MVQEQNEEGDADDLQDEDQLAQPLDFTVYLFLGNHDGHGPSGAVHTVEEHVVHFSVVLQGGLSRLPGKHGPVDGVVSGGIFHGGGQLLNGMLHDQGLCRADHNLARPAHQHAEGRRIHFDGAHQFREPVQGDIGRKNSGHAAFLVLDRNGIGGHEHVAAALVEIRFGPVASLQFQRLHEPLLTPVVILFGGQGRGGHFFTGGERIRGDVFFGERHRGAADDGIVPHQANRYGCQAVRTGQLLLHAPQAVADGGFHLVHDAGNLQFGGLQLALGPAVGLFGKDFLRIEILKEGGAFQGKDGDNHHQQSLPGRHLRYAV